MTPQITMSKNMMRRIEHTSVLSATPVKFVDGKWKYAFRLRFDIGRFLDRSKYNGDGSLK